MSKLLTLHVQKVYEECRLEYYTNAYHKNYIVDVKFFDTSIEGCLTFINHNFV